MPASCGVRATASVESMTFASSSPLGGPPEALWGRVKPSGPVFAASGAVLGSLWAGSGPSWP
eukprot:9053493-Pyramimonas_sp.AAC.2